MCQEPQADACGLSGLSGTPQPAAFGLNPDVESRGVTPVAEPQQGMAYRAGGSMGQHRAIAWGPASRHTQPPLSNPAVWARAKAQPRRSEPPCPCPPPPPACPPTSPGSPGPGQMGHLRPSSQKSQRPEQSSDADSLSLTLKVGKIFRFTKALPLNPNLCHLQHAPCRNRNTDFGVRMLL